jgi:hypothetical protein
VLLNNGTWFGRLRPTGGMGAIPSALRANANRIKLWENAQRFGQFKSMPGGYTQASRAIIPTIKTSDFIAVRMVGEGSFSASAYGIGSLSVTLTGEGSTTFNGQMGSHATVNLTGEGSLTGTPRGIGSASVVMDAGARPSAFDIAQEVWNSQKTSYNAAGTMGNALNNASSGGVDYNALAQAVWEYTTRTLTAGGGGGGATPADIAAAVWAYVSRTLTANPGITTGEMITALNATTIPVNIKKVNDVTVKGVGTAGNPWNPV